MKEREAGSSNLALPGWGQVVDLTALCPSHVWWDCGSVGLWPQGAQGPFLLQGLMGPSDHLSLPGARSPPPLSLPPPSLYLGVSSTESAGMVFLIL